MTKNLKLFLTVLFLFQIIISSGYELAHDEAYYWLFSQHLDWGYFDHPPFVALIIKALSFLPKSELSVRMGFIICQFGALIILLLLTSFNFTSLLLFFSFPLASFSGLFALPDTPLLFFSSLYIFQLKKYLENSSNKNSAFLGCIIACMIYAKYHGILLVFFTIIALPKLFLRRTFYQTAFLSILCLIPHFWWQYQNGFPTFQYQLFERPSATFSFLRSLNYLVSEVFLAGLFMGPIVWYIVFKFKSRSDFERSLKFISFGTIIFFLVSSINKKMEANWSVFLTLPLIYLVCLSQVSNTKLFRKILWISFITVFSSRILLILPPESVGIKRLKEFHGWKNFSFEIKKRCEEGSILANNYQMASKISFYLDQEIHALNYRSRMNQFDIWRFDLKEPTKDVCYITDKKEFHGEPILGPDGKTMHIVKNESMERLRELKSSLR